MPSPTATISAQPGPQTEFLRTPTDICVYGGAAGGGKTVGLILEPLRHVSRVANFTAVFFRRTMPQITNPGALWDESLNFYPRLGGTPHLGGREWRWSRGGKTLANGSTAIDGLSGSGSTGSAGADGFLAAAPTVLYMAAPLSPSLRRHPRQAASEKLGNELISAMVKITLYCVDPGL